MPRGRIANTLDDFWPYITETDKSKCWLWQGTIHKSGYGTFCINKTLYQAHRVAYYLSRPGEIELLAPHDKSVKQFVLHKCDVRACCNPRHLFLGSVSDNSEDMVKKNRQRGAKGETNPASKLSHKNVKRIWKLLSERKFTQWEIADLFGVSQSAVSLIKRKKTYAEVTCKEKTLVL